MIKRGWETQSKRDQVRSYLIGELQSGKYAPGAVFLSENEVIRKLGFCKNTVREAFSSLVGDGVLERVRGKGTFVREPASRSGSEGIGKKVVHLIAGDPMKKNQEDPFVGQALLGLHQSLDRYGWQIRLHLISPVVSVIDSIRSVITSMEAGECRLGGWTRGSRRPRPVERDLRKRVDHVCRVTGISRLIQKGDLVAAEELRHAIRPRDGSVRVDSA